MKTNTYYLVSVKYKKGVQDLSRNYGDLFLIEKRAKRGFEVGSRGYAKRFLTLEAAYKALDHIRNDALIDFPKARFFKVEERFMQPPLEVEVVPEGV